MFGSIGARFRWVLGWRARERERHARWDAHGEALHRQVATLDLLHGEIRHLHESLGGREPTRLEAIEGELARVEDAAARARSSAEDALAAARHAVARADDALGVAGHAADGAAEALLPARIAALDAWLALHPPAEDVLISVVLATRDRPTLLRRAVASVSAQRYAAWQLVVVDDGESDPVAAALAGVDDERVVRVEGERRGLGAARNAGLARAEGEVVCYLDDDNVMHPDWLRAVAHAFAHAGVDVAYGVTLAERRIPDAEGPDGMWPSFWQLPWARETALEQNPADAGALAHRRELEGARFDEGLPTGEDWDLLIRLTVERPALAVPAVSHAYLIDGEHRMSRDPAHVAGLEAIRRRYAGERPSSAAPRASDG